jgi:hypothetical protein
MSLFIDKFTKLQKEAMIEGDVTLFIHLSFFLSQLRCREARKKNTEARNEIHIFLDEEENQLLDIQERKLRT